MPQRRLQDRIEALVTKALATHDPNELDEVIRQLGEALHEHAKLLRNSQVALESHRAASREDRS